MANDRRRDLPRVQLVLFLVAVVLSWSGLGIILAGKDIVGAALVVIGSLLFMSFGRLLRRRAREIRDSRGDPSTD